LTVKGENGEAGAGERHTVFRVKNYDLAATLNSGQVFRWRRAKPIGDAAKVPNSKAGLCDLDLITAVPASVGASWAGVVGERWVHLEQAADVIEAVAAVPVSDWQWLEEYLQLGTDIGVILKTFPDDGPMRTAVAACRGLRLLRQNPWECLASFILSSTKQIVQIQQIVAALCECYGERISALPGFGAAYRFPSPERLAVATEEELRRCKMGFRAPYLLETARRVAAGSINLDGLRQKPVEEARARLMELPGVGRKVADCVLLFAYGFQSSFPLDVWVFKGLRQLYFRNRQVRAARLEKFVTTHFGPYAGYAQQYLFHYMRTRERLKAAE
jgi:N-glycosylase/DNA lyase